MVAPFSRTVVLRQIRHHELSEVPSTGRRQLFVQIHADRRLDQWKLDDQRQNDILAEPGC